LRVSRRFVVNSSPLILLGRISRLDLLPALADEVLVPRTVLQELAVKSGQDWLATTVSSHPGLVVVDDFPISDAVRKWNLGAGESAVIAFCLANPGHRAVLDDLRGRHCAQALGIPLIGTLGVLVAARRQGLIPQARPLIAAIRGAGYYIEDKLIEAALSEVGEKWLD
jgi:predicted nucleic acid-binding protein